jgi:SAM-dependent methyltransferase
MGERMKNYSLKQRAEFYSKAFPKYPSLRVDERWIDSMWFMGNNYKGSGFYGSYPPGYVKRIMSLFPDAENILHLFSGSLPKSKKYTRFDINPKLCDVCGNAENLSKYFKKKFDLILADTIYSKEDALHFGTPMINRNKTVKECVKVLRKGGYLIWLDQVLPMYRKIELLHCIAIGIIRSTNHRFRIVSGFKRV